MLKWYIAFFITFSLLACNEHEKIELPPNIIFIMSDDHANAAVSCYGSKLIETTNIDRIAKEGILFKNSFVTNSICAPSRAVLLTGKYSHLNGLRDNRDQFDGGQMTFPKLLREAGYYTAMIGKWHLKTTPTGFDYWNILIGQGDYYNPTMIAMGDTATTIGYTSNVITDFALETLEKRDTTKPFCLIYNHKAPHRNWMPHPDHFDLFEGKELPIPETFYDDYEGRPAAAQQDMRIDDMYLAQDMKLQPRVYGEDPGSGGGPPGFDSNKSWARTYNRFTSAQKKIWDEYYDPIIEDYKRSNRSGKELSEWKLRRYLEDYLKSVKSVDDNIGRVLKYLDENGLTENTLVVYTSDQGFYLGEHGWYDKRFMYEESLRMPLVMRYPKKIKAGSINDDIVLNLDFAPTLLHLAGINVPESMQGSSLTPLLEGNSPDDWRQSMFYQYFEYPHGWHSVKRHYGVRTHQHKLIHYYNDMDYWELYDLRKDPSEMNNVYSDPSYTKVQQDLHNELDRLIEEYKVPPDAD